MSDPEQQAEPSIPLFDVSVSVPSSVRLTDIERQALHTGIAPDRVSRLMQVLKSSPHAKIGAGVTREKADLAEEQFGAAGLIVTVTPLLAIQAGMAGSYDGTCLCPACDKRVVLPDNRQCPACGIFVDKVTDEFLLRRKLMEQERGKIEFQNSKSSRESEKRAREIMEATLRAKVREEVEREFGIKGSKRGFLQGSSGLLRMAGLAGLLAAAFVGGRGLSPEGLPWKKSEEVKQGAGPAAMTADSLEKTAQAATGGGGESAAADEALHPDLDDPLIQAAGGKRVGAKGLTIEQALAASQTLAKSVGNTTAQRALAGAPAGGPGGGGATGAGATSNTGASAGGDYVAVAATGKTESAGGAVNEGAIQPGNAATAPDVPKTAKLVLAAEFGKVLAELGQSPRAREILRATAAAPEASSPETAAALRNAQSQAQAWAIQRREAGPTSQAVEALKTSLQAVANPVERTRLQGRAAVILSRGGQLPQDVSRSFLNLATDSLKSVTGPGQPSAALGDLAVSMAEVFANEVAARAKAGAWTRAQAGAAQIEGLIRQAPDPWAQARLYAVDHQVRQQLGQADKARQSLDAALALVAKNPNLQERASWLHSIAQLADAAAQEQMDTMTASLQTQLGSKSGMEKAQAMTQLSLMYASGGLPARAEQFRRLAQATTGLSSAENTSVNMDLIVRGDLAMARVLQGLGRYAEAEAMLQRVGGYLL